MKSTRFLLPFTQGIDLGALEYAVQFARSCQAKLIPLALIPLSEQQWAKGPRLEAIEQANDFLEAVKYKAERAEVVVEPCEMGTRDVVRSLNMFAQEMMCEGMLLFLRGGTTVLLPPEVVKRLLEQATCRMYLVRLQPKDRPGPVQTLLKWCSNCICRWRGHREGALPLQGHAFPAGEMITFSNGLVTTRAEQEGKGVIRNAGSTYPAS